VEDLKINAFCRFSDPTAILAISLCLLKNILAHYKRTIAAGSDTNIVLHFIRVP